MLIGRWYDPIEGKWHTPRVAAPNDYERQQAAYRALAGDVTQGETPVINHELWEAVVATAQATQQESNP